MWHCKRGLTFQNLWQEKSPCLSSTCLLEASTGSLVQTREFCSLSGSLVISITFSPPGKCPQKKNTVLGCTHKKDFVGRKLLKFVILSASERRVL